MIYFIVYIYLLFLPSLFEAEWDQEPYGINESNDPMDSSKPQYSETEFWFITHDTLNIYRPSLDNNRRYDVARKDVTGMRKMTFQASFRVLKRALERESREPLIFPDKTKVSLGKVRRTQKPGLLSWSLLMISLESAASQPASFESSPKKKNASHRSWSALRWLMASCHDGLSSVHFKREKMKREPQNYHSRGAQQFDMLPPSPLPRKNTRKTRKSPLSSFPFSMKGKVFSYVID